MICDESKMVLCGFLVDLGVLCVSNSDMAARTAVPPSVAGASTAQMSEVLLARDLAYLSDDDY